MGLHFISYSRRDGQPFADWLYAALWKTAPDSQPWMDRNDVVPGYPFETQVEDAISRCDTLLLVCSPDARNSDKCQDERTRADQLVKPVIPLQVHPEAELPMGVGRLTVIDFVGGKDAGLDELRRGLKRLASPTGKLQQLKEQRRRWERELLVAKDADRHSIQQKIDDLQEQIDELSPVVANPSAAARGRQAGIDAGIASEREHRLSSARLGQVYVNWLPPNLPGQLEFRDRKDEIDSLSRHLQDDGVRLVSVTGPEGIGKTRMVCELLEELRSNHDATGVDAIVYLTAHGGKPVSAPGLLAELRRAVPADVTTGGEEPPTDSDLPLLQKLDALLIRLGGTRIVLTIDGVERLLDEATGEFQQHDLDELLRYLVFRRGHQVTVLLLSRVRPEPMLRRLSGRSREVLIETGLPFEEARDLLRGLDADDAFALDGEQTALLDRAYALTKGHPRALEALFGNLTLPQSPYTSLGQLLDAAGARPDKVLDFLIGQMFKHLDPLSWSVMQALAIYDQPVSRTAVEDLLRPYIRDRPVNSAIQRLLRARLIRREEDRYYLPAPDDKRVFDLIPKGGPADREREPPPFTRTALLHRAAARFAKLQTDDVRGIEDLSPHLAEIDVLLRGEEYERALRLISEIDARYLARWGYSQVLTRQRETLQNNLETDWHRLVNLNALGRIYELGNKLTDAVACYSQALDIAKRLNRVDSQKKLYVNLASVQMARGWLHEALDYYRRALAMAKEHGQRAEEARPLAGLAECYARTGAFPRALQYAGKALTIAREQAQPDLFAEVLLRIGRWRGQLGQTLAALECFGDGLRLAKARDNHPLEGRFLDGIAELLIDQGRLARATILAEQAVETGQRANSPTLRREAGFTLALSRLCKGDLEAARAAVETASAYRRPGQAPSLLALQGIILLQLGDVTEAGQAFEAALGEVKVRQDREWNRRDRDFALLDLMGVALCGRALCRDQWDGVERAAEAFREAREVTRAPGIVARVLRLLCELDATRQSDALAVALRAASGEAELRTDQPTMRSDHWGVDARARPHA
jgi:tetratricopeptide (TPR) repeat protein